jgi:hypothetical protein
MESIQEKPGDPMIPCEPAVMSEVKSYEDKYHIKMDEKHKIGAGQFGYVFKISRKSDGKVLAMKVSRLAAE